MTGWTNRTNEANGTNGLNTGNCSGDSAEQGTLLWLESMTGRLAAGSGFAEGRGDGKGWEEETAKQRRKAPMDEPCASHASYSSIVV